MLSIVQIFIYSISFPLLLQGLMKCSKIIQLIIQVSVITLKVQVSYVNLTFYFLYPVIVLRFFFFLISCTKIRRSWTETVYDYLIRPPFYQSFHFIVMFFLWFYYSLLWWFDFYASYLLAQVRLEYGGAGSLRF